MPWSDQLLSMGIKIIILAIAIFYVAFSAILLQKTRYMSKTIINEMGRVLVIFCLINFTISIVMTAAFLLIQKGS